MFPIPMLGFVPHPNLRTLHGYWLNIPLAKVEVRFASPNTNPSGPMFPISMLGFFLTPTFYALLRASEDI